MAGGAIAERASTSAAPLRLASSQDGRAQRAASWENRTQGRDWAGAEKLTGHTGRGVRLPSRWQAQQAIAEGGRSCEQGKGG